MFAKDTRHLQQVPAFGDNMILVVEDDEACRCALVRLLKHRKIDAVGVCSGSEALLYLQDHLPNLIVLDVMMPDMSGLDVLDRIRADARLAQAPVVMFSAVEVDAIMTRAFAAGAREFLVKSRDLDRLLALAEQAGPPPQSVHS